MKAAYSKPRSLFRELGRAMQYGKLCSFGKPTKFVVPVDDAIDNRISLTPGSVPLYEKPHQKCLQTIDLDFYFHKAKMNHFDLIEETLQKSKERPNNSIFLGMVSLEHFFYVMKISLYITRTSMFIKLIWDRKLDWM